MIDIGKPPHENLSNFSHYCFEFDGVKCNSFEGFLQALKFHDIDKQVSICSMIGIKAKRKGQKKKWYLTHKLYWQGKSYCRFSPEYKALVKSAYNAMFEQSCEFKIALLETGDGELIHSIGKESEHHTVLTESEFVSILTDLRNKLSVRD